MKNCIILALSSIFCICLIPETGRPCTSFCLDNNGHPVLGTNLDFPWGEGLLVVNKRNVSKKGWEPSTTGEQAKWISKYGSVTFNLVGYQYAWAGINEAGLVISTMRLPETKTPAPDERPPLDTGVWVQYQLDNCSTVEEVIASNKEIRIITPDHYLVSDRAANCATIEFIDNKMVCHTNETMPVKALANNTYAQSIKYWKRSPLNRFFGELFSKPSFSLRRFEIAANRVTNFVPKKSESAVDYAFDTLKKASGQRVGGTDTQWSIVFDTATLRAYFRTKTNQKVRFFDLNACDFSCSKPVKMLDVNENLSGDVAGHFKDYSH